jgi:hypothetical protein
VANLVRAYRIPLLEIGGIEADDVIGPLARRFEGEGVNVVIVSGDKDLMQLVSDAVVMIDTMKDKTYDAAGVEERFGVGPTGAELLPRVTRRTTSSGRGGAQDGTVADQRVRLRRGCCECREDPQRANLKAVTEHAEQASFRELAVEDRRRRRACPRECSAMRP